MSDNNTSNKTIAKNTLFLSIRMVVVLVINLFTTRIVLQALGVIDYGVYNVVCGFVAMFAFLNTSMSNGIQRFFNYEYGKNGEQGANKVYCTSLYIQAFLALIVIIIVEAFGLWYLHNKMVIPADRMVAAEWIFQFSILSFLMGIMQAPYAAAVTAHQRFDFYAIISVLDAVLKLIIAYAVLIVISDKLIIYGVLSAIISIIDILIYIAYCKRHFQEIRFKPGLNMDFFKKMIGFSGWNLFGSFAGIAKDQGINLVLNFFFGPVVNAARGVAMQVKGGVYSFVSNINIPIRPQVTQSYAKGDIDRTMNLTYSVSKLSSFILLIISIPIAFEIDFLLRIWLGSEVPAHSGSFTILILCTALISTLNWATSGIVHATGIMKEYQIWGAIPKICSVPIAYFLLLAYKIPELAFIAVLICDVISHTLGLFVVRKLVKMSLWSYMKKVILPITIVFVIILASTSSVHNLIENDILRLITVCLISTISGIVSSYFIAFDEREKKMSLQLFSSVLKRIGLEQLALRIVNKKE